MKGSAVTVSVVLPAYNAGPYLKMAVDSILHQTFTDFELLVINDGSTDNTARILAEYTDPRLRVLSQRNKGLVASLNRGITEARGRYIARHDADDRSESQRFAKQTAFLDNNPKIVIVGSSMSVMDMHSDIKHDHRVLLRDTELRQELLVRSPFAHGSVMFRRAAAVRAGLYNQAFWPAEDYEFWLRLSREGQLANLDDCHYIYRENSDGISAAETPRQLRQVRDIQELAWQQRGRLVGTSGIKLAPYRKLVMGPERISRIVDNVTAAATKARQRGDTAFAGRCLRQLAASPSVYRQLAAKMRAAARNPS